MKFLKFTFIFIFSVAFFTSATAQKYKAMMNNYQVNFYDVVAEAERYFAANGKEEGSGWKGYMRWKTENEGKFGPSGDRSQVSPYFVENGYLDFVKKYGNAEKTTGSNAWQDLGPYSADNITTGYNPGIGRVIALWVDPNNEANIYMGARGGGFWATKDTGNTWMNSTDFLVASGVSSIAASPTFPDSVLIAVRNARNNATHGIFRSVNGGQSWDTTSFIPANLGWGGLGTVDQIYTVAISPHNNNLVFVGSSKGLFRSTDNIQTWTQVIATGNIKDVKFHPTKDSVVYVYNSSSATANQIFVSTNGGVSFTGSNTIPGNNGTGTGILSVSKAEPNWVFYASRNGIWKSTDEGVNFTFLSNPNSSCYGFAVSDTSVNYMTYGYVDNFNSSNGGSTFAQYSWWYLFNQNTTPFNYVHADTRVAACVNGVFYIGTDGYLCKSEDNLQTWKKLNNGTGIREFYRVGVSQSTSTLNMAGSQDCGTSILNKNGWLEWNGGDGMEAVIQPLNESWMIGSWQFGNRNRTKDGGLTRQNVKHEGKPYWDAPMLLDPNNQMTVYSFADSVYRSDEFGGNWINMGEPSFIGAVLDAAIAENNSQIIFVARYNAIERSTDGGLTFTNITNTSTNQYVSDIATDPLRDSTVIVTYAHHWNYKRIFISHDLGNTWTNITFNLNKIPARSVVIDRSGNIYIGAEMGVYTMPLNGSGWTLYNTDLPNVAVTELEIQQATNILRATTWGRGLWQAPLLGKESFPKIVEIKTSEIPTDINPLQGVPMFVNSVVSYNGTVTSSFVKWSVNTPVFDSIIAMTNTVDSTWKTVNPIPDQAVGTKVYFKVFAVGGNNDTTESYKFMYTVKFNPSFGLEDNLEKRFKIYPNPTTDFLTIQLDENYKKVNVNVFDLSGKQVLSRSFSQTEKVKINLAQLPSGSYSVQVVTDAKTEVHLVVVE